MSDHHLKVFRDLHVVDWYVNCVAGKLFAFASVKAKNGMSFHPNGICLANYFDDIRRIATSGKDNENIVSVRQGTELIGEDIFVSRIIGQAGIYGNICGQGMDLQSLSVFR